MSTLGRFVLGVLLLFLPLGLALLTLNSQLLYRHSDEKIGLVVALACGFVITAYGIVGMIMVFLVVTVLPISLAIDLLRPFFKVPPEEKKEVGTGGRVFNR